MIKKIFFITGLLIFNLFQAHSFNLEFGWHMVKGNKDTCEDRYVIYKQNGIKIFAVFDGQAGIDVTTYFTKKFTENFFRFFYSDNTIKTALEKSITKIKKEISFKHQSSYVIVVCDTIHKQWTITHAGAPKAILFNQYGKKRFRPLISEITELEVLDGDHLLIASKGYWKTFSPKKARVNFLNHNQMEFNYLARMLCLETQYINRKDDITVILVKVNDPTEQHYDFDALVHDCISICCPCLKDRWKKMKDEKSRCPFDKKPKIKHI